MKGNVSYVDDDIVDVTATIGTEYLNFEQQTCELSKKIIEQKDKILELKEELRAQKQYLEDLQDKLIEITNIGHEWTRKNEPLFLGMKGE